jgi:DNA-binding SARP family transcriptional activator/tetratricopeptide (TPR) repeat protein
MPTMPSRPSSGAVAPRRDASTSTEPEDAVVARDDAPAIPARHEGRGPRRPMIVVKGTEPTTVASHSSGEVPPLAFPVQPSKVQAPPLRDDTLSRDRLLDWLSIKIHSRVVLLVAEAGYGKTTLLADFSRRTRIRMLWFRLDRGDRDWLGFIAHLIAAVRIHTPTFGSATATLLRETPTSVPSFDAVLDTFLRELGSLRNDPTAVVFDDVHLVDDSPEVKQILRELLGRAPDRMSFVFASRREPPVRLARLRALGEVAELDTDDLRFDAKETEQLFSETYDIALEPSVLAELSRRTEGWAASLQLVRAAIHDRNPSQVRAFVASLSGAEGHLYEYLAEEVIGDLPEDLQQFLMRTSVLDTVDLALGSVAAGVSETEAREFIDQAEGYGLLTKRGQAARYIVRPHPLVRDFLASRLVRILSLEGVREIHARVARAAEINSWDIAARHYVGAGLETEARRVLAAAIERVLATGEYATAFEVSSALASGALEGAPGLILQSRVSQQRGALDDGVALAERAWELDPDAAAVLINLATARALAGNVAGALEATRRLGASQHGEWAAIGRTFEKVLQASLNGSLSETEADLSELAAALRHDGAHHYRGVALHNLAVTKLARGDFESALSSSEEAILELESSSAGVELVSARIAHGVARAFLGEIEVARDEFASVITGATNGQLLEIAAEIGETEALVGESAKAWSFVNSVAVTIDASDRAEEARFSRALLHLHDGDLGAAREDVTRFRHGTGAVSPAFDAKRYLAEGLLVALEGGGLAASTVRGTTIATEQGADLWSAFGRLLSALADETSDPSSTVIEASSEMPASLSCLANLAVTRLSDMNAAALDAVTAEAQLRPWRWRMPVRRAIAAAQQLRLLRLAELLEKIGEAEDVRRLRDIGQRIRNRRGPRLGFALARRLAQRVFVEDLGRVTIAVGARVIDGADVRRKVLALLCLLISKPRFAATREEVLDSLWPEHDPDSAMNSLNQTVYFLRRVFEPDFRDDVSPGYVGQDGETVWLDGDLVEARSRRCLEMIRTMPGDPTPEGAVALATEYRGRFALDFAYEDWSASYRDALHAGYLRIVERAVCRDLDSGHFGRGIFVAERAAEVDPDAEEIQVALVRLYRHSGAHAAAAEQYAHYTRFMGDLGVEPRRFLDL